jgi:hypothetical protein
MLRISLALIQRDLFLLIGFTNTLIIMKTSNIPVVIQLSKEEVNSLKQFCDDNLAHGTVLITQSSESGIGLTTKVMVKDLPETMTDITDIDNW